MPITWNVNAEKRHVHVTVVAPYTRDQGREAATAITSDPAFTRAFGFLIDTIGPVDPHFLRDVAYFFGTHREKFRGQRAAIVLGLRSMSDSQLENVDASDDGTAQVTIRSFRTYKAAELWLATRDSI
jgi:hypothetical protein